MIGSKELYFQQYPGSWPNASSKTSLGIARTDGLTFVKVYTTIQSLPRPVLSVPSTTQTDLH